MASTSSDQLTAALEQMRAWASERRIAWVTGHSLEASAGVPAVRFAHESAEREPLASAREFMQALSALDVAMLVVSVITLDEDSQQAAVGLFQEPRDELNGPGADEARSVLDTMLADAHEARHHIGKAGRATVTAITRNPTVTIEWAEMADWYAVVDAAEEAFAEMADVDVGDVGDDDDFDMPDDDDDWAEIEPDPEPPRRRIGG